MESPYWKLSLKVSPKFALVLAFVFLVVSAGVVYLFAFLGKAWAADMIAGRSLRNQGITPDSAVRFAKAANYMGHESRYVSILGQIYLSLANQEAAKPEGERNLERLKGYLETASQFLRLGRNMSSNSVAAQQFLAQGYENILLVAGPSTDILNSLQQAYERALELEPSNPVFHLKLGQIERVRANAVKSEEQTGHITAAKRHFERALEWKQNFIPASVNLALVEETIDKNQAAAIATLEKASRLDSSQPDVKYQLARLYRLRAGEGDLNRSETMFKELVAVNNRNINAYLNLGLIYEKTNRASEAVAVYQKVKDLLKGDGQGMDLARKEVDKLIENAKNGRLNNLDQTSAVTQAQPALSDDFPEPAPAPDSTPPEQNPTAPAPTRP